MKVSIIVPCKKMDYFARRCVDHCEARYPDYELIVVTDSVCPGLPATKRNWAMQKATGDVFAFIDSDAYPSRDWLKHALYWLQTFDAVCGPGVLPADAERVEHIADKVHQWLFAPYRVKAMAPRIVTWFPSFNLIVKRSVATEFDSYLTGEDERFAKKIRGGIFYHPDILVYHNRRGAFSPLWRQFGTWGRHKGHFAKLALLAWVTTVWTYAVNYVKGFLKWKL